MKFDMHIPMSQRGGRGLLSLIALLLVERLQK